MLVFVGVTVEHRLYQRKVDVDMLSAVENILADVSSVKLSSEQYLKRQLLTTTFFTAFSVTTSTFL